MDLAQALLLALIQGITEFLPVSSSAHLILSSKLLGWPDEGLAFDTAVHLGSLIAVIAYFRETLIRLIVALYQQTLQSRPSEEGRFAINLIIASLPIIVVGFLVRFTVEAEFRSVEIIALATIVFGIALWAADQFSQKRNLSEESGDRAFDKKNALLIGLAQCLALIPGASRSGVTMTMALALGFSRTKAAEISLLISIPAIAGAGFIKFYDLAHQPPDIHWQSLIPAMILSAISAYACIALFLGWIERIGFTPFVIYRLILGFGLLWLSA